MVPCYATIGWEVTLERIERRNPRVQLQLSVLHFITRSKYAWTHHLKSRNHDDYSIGFRSLFSVKKMSSPATGKQAGDSFALRQTSRES